MKKVLFFLLPAFFFLTQAASAQRFNLHGKITSKDGETLTSGTLRVKGSKRRAHIDLDGGYNIVLPNGTYTVLIDALGYEELEEKVIIKDKDLKKNFVVHPTQYSLDEYIVYGKSPIQNVRESPFNVVAIDAKAFHHTSLDVASALDRVSGVKVRSDGGVGADVSFSLNGFGGRHVKFFMDGVPMAGFGAAFSLSNIPIGQIDRIEVYKGVVPVEFGADALGGVINLVSNKHKSTHLDASFTAGSFDTYKTEFNFSKVFNNGFAAQLNGFHNFSNNTYKVYIDPDYSGHERWVKRFNDRFNSATGTIKLGFVDKPFADKLFVGFTYGKGRKGIQHGTTMTKVFGKRHQRTETIMPSIEYSKRNLFTEGLSLKLTGNYNLGYTQNIDTVAAMYNWLGVATPKMAMGESGGGPTMVKYYNNNGSSTLNTTYTINKQHQVSLNDVFTLFKRKIKDPLARKETDSEKKSEERKRSLKNILGVSYQFTPNKNFTSTVFGKHYWTKHRNATDSRTKGVFGYGLTTTYNLYDLQLKASYERTHRLPTSTELFGDGALEWSNFDLKAEKGDNFNVGLNGTKIFRRMHTFYFDVSYNYRLISDYITRHVYGEGSRASTTNHGEVTSSGVNVEVRYIFRNMVNVGANYTSQDVKNKERYVVGSTLESSTYKLRMPNVPYRFGNADAGITFRNVGQAGNSLYVGYNLHYIYKFYYDWSIFGEKSSKSTIPTQLSHDVNASYSFLKKAFTLSVEMNNLANRKLYDNYYIQKPGRNFMFKLRYVYR